MFDVALIRHPAVVVAPATCYGRLDLPLAAGWQAWVARLSIPLARLAPARVWSSPASRCALVAEQLSQRLQRPLTVDKRLVEVNFGAWEGRLWDDLPREALDRWAADPLGFSAPGGETGEALIERVAAFASTLIEKSQPCVVISHGGPLRVLAGRLRGEPPDLLAAPPAVGGLEIVRGVQDRRRAATSGTRSI